MAYKKKVNPIKFTAKVPQIATIENIHIQSRFNFKKFALFFCFESDTFLWNSTIR